jgi:hypothetical protein
MRLVLAIEIRMSMPGLAELLEEARAALRHTIHRRQCTSIVGKTLLTALCAVLHLHGASVRSTRSVWTAASKLSLWIIFLLSTKGKLQVPRKNTPSFQIESLCFQTCKKSLSFQSCKSKTIHLPLQSACFITLSSYYHRCKRASLQCRSNPA